MARQKTVGLTPRQQETLQWIKVFIAKNGLPPTVREVGGGLEIKGSTAFGLIEALSDKGYLRRGNLGARSLSLVDSDSHEFIGSKLRAKEPHGAVYGVKGTDGISVPLLGRVAAGRPILAVENQVGEVTMNKKIVSHGQFFALEISGDSMTEAGIKDGDVVIVRQQPVAQNGETVVALLGDEATVKQLSINEDRIELRPRNAAHRSIPISHEDDFRILGKVIAVVPNHDPHIKRRNANGHFHPKEVLSSGRA